MEYKSDILQNALFEGFSHASDNVYIYVCDMDMGISRWSMNAVQYFDLEDEYILDAGAVWGQKVHPDDRKLYFDDIEAVFSGRRNQHSCQYRAINRFGNYVWLECKGTMVYDADGNAKVFSGMMTRLDSQSKYDPLTGIFTKNELYDYDFESGSGSVLLFGIDDFRKIINVYGYDYGDVILTTFVKTIADILGDKDKFIRFQGDEFAVILPGADKEDVYILFQQIAKAIGYMRTNDGRLISLTVSAGADSYPLKSGNKDDIISHLELAMDYAKQKARGEITFYSDEIAAAQVRKNTLKRDLKAAIANGFEGFELFFQPWVDPKDSRIVGCEALLRFTGREIKNTTPFEFIPILEEDNGIIEVGDWVMREAMKQQNIWQEQYGDFKVSFNVSYRQFFEEGFADKILRTAVEYGAKPENMVLELTESNAVDRPETLAQIFKEIRGHKFHIALDDFGTGYASLGILKKIAVDEIKIEHNFVRELRKEEGQVDLAIIESIMFLCSKINCSVIVEGVENEEVNAIIRNMAADYLQGYFYSKPVDKDSFNRMLEAGRSKREAENP